MMDERKKRRIPDHYPNQLDTTCWMDDLWVVYSFCI